MTAIIKEEILPYSAEILRALNGCRFDKIKPVREATLETIKLIKEIAAEHPQSQFTQSQEIGGVEEFGNTTTNTTEDLTRILRGSGGSRKQISQGNLQPEIIRDRSNGARSARPNPKSPLSIS